MRYLFLSFVLSFITPHVCVASNLQPEAVALLKAAIENSGDVPASMTPEKLYQTIAEEVDFGVSEIDAGLLRERRRLRESKEVDQAVKTSSALSTQKFPISDETVVKALKDPAADVRTKEAAFRLLSHFNRMKLKSVTTQNISYAKQLCVAILSGDRVKAISDIEGHEKLQFKYLAGGEDWIYSPTGFGELGDAAPYGGKVILMAPRTINGALVMGCDNGSVYALSIEKIRERIDVSKVKTQE